MFRVTNTSNGAQDFRIAADNVQPPAAIFGRADAFDMSNFTLHISAAACSTATMTTPTYAGEAATTFIGALAEDSCKYVFVRSDTPVSPTAANGLILRVAAEEERQQGLDGGDVAEDVGDGHRDAGSRKRCCR